MSRLAEIFDVPQIAVDWVLAPNGKPLKLGFTPSADIIRTIFGELLSTIETLLLLSPTIAAKQSIMGSPFVQRSVQRVKDLWTIANTRDSVGRELWDKERFLRLLSTPTTLLERITREAYFFKDKPERLLALQCILNAKIAYIEHSSSPDGDVSDRLRNVLAQPVFNQPLVFYSGYQWRSDPHCGVAVNLDYLYCRQDKGRTPQQRKHALVLFYPRIFYSRDSEAYKKTVNDIGALAKRQGDFYDLFIKRYKSAADANSKIDQLLLTEGQYKLAEDLIGIWGDGTKQSRIFRQYCDLIILSDAVIAGNHWQSLI